MKKKMTFGPMTAGIIFAVFAAAVARDDKFAGAIYLMLALYFLVIAE